MAICDINGNIISSSSSGFTSPIQGKKICLIGDSNTQYSSNIIKEYMENTYGCTFTPLGYAGATWENADGVTHTYSAIGRVNSLIANANSNNLCTEYDIVTIMMGTNCTTKGALTDTSATLNTMCGAIRYCLEKLSYYYRQKKIGVVLPFQRNEFNDDQKTKNNLIKSICDEYSIPTKDMYTQSQITAESKTPDGNSLYLGDGLHMGGNGQTQFCQTYGKWVAYEL